MAKDEAGEVASHTHIYTLYNTIIRQISLKIIFDMRDQVDLCLCKSALNLACLPLKNSERFSRAKTRLGMTKRVEDEAGEVYEEHTFAR